MFQRSIGVSFLRGIYLHVQIACGGCLPWLRALCIVSECWLTAQHKNAKVVIIHAGTPRDSFEAALRKELGARGIQVIQRDMEQDVKRRTKAACQTANLVIFVLSCEFFGNPECMDELRWVLDERAACSAELPMIKTLLYPADMRGYTTEQLKSMLPAERHRHEDTLHETNIRVDDLSPLSSELKQLIQRHLPLLPSARQLQKQQTAVMLEQRIQDVETLANFFSKRVGPCPR